MNALGDEEDHRCQHYHDCPSLTRLVLLLHFVGTEALLVHAFEVLLAVIVGDAGVSYLASTNFSLEATVKQTANFFVVLEQAHLLVGCRVSLEVTAIKGVVTGHDAVFDVHAHVVFVVELTALTGTFVVKLTSVADLLQASQTEGTRLASSLHAALRWNFAISVCLARQAALKQRRDEVILHCVVQDHLVWYLYLHLKLSKNR